MSMSDLLELLHNFAHQRPPMIFETLFTIKHIILQKKSGKTPGQATSRKPEFVRYCSPCPYRVIVNNQGQKPSTTF